MGGLQLREHLPEQRLECDAGAAAERNPAAEASARKIHDVVDQMRHAEDATLHHGFDLVGVIVRFRLA